MSQSQQLVLLSHPVLYQAYRGHLFDDYYQLSQSMRILVSCLQHQLMEIAELDRIAHHQFEEVHHFQIRLESEDLNPYFHGTTRRSGAPFCAGIGLP